MQTRFSSSFVANQKQYQLLRKIVVLMSDVLFMKYDDFLLSVAVTSTLKPKQKWLDLSISVLLG